jgi:hypothetical protein
MRRTLWSRLVALNQPLPVKESLRYVDYLIADRQIAQAHEAWQQLVRLTPALRRYQSSQNQIVNGGFEEDILNDGFDWRYDGRSGVTITIDVSEPHSGARALAIAFEGSPPDAGLYQLISVEPNTHYHLSINVKAEGLVGVQYVGIAAVGVVQREPWTVTRRSFFAY